MPDDLERILTDVPATFPRPDAETTARARARIRLGRGPRRTRRLGLATALLIAALIGSAFTVGRWVVPARGVTATSISFDVRPKETEAFFGPVSGFGAVANGRSGETVIVEVRECDGYGQWTTNAKVETGNGGTWLATLGATSNATFRATWGSSTSDPVRVRVHPHVELRGPFSGGVFSMRVAAGRFFGGSTAVLERLAGKRWIRVRTFTLRRADGMGQVPWSYAQFRARVKKRTTVRVVVPQSQVGRCYLPGVSNVVRA